MNKYRRIDLGTIVSRETIVEMSEKDLDLFVFKKKGSRLKSLLCQQLIFDYLDLSKLVEIRGLSLSFLKLLRSGAVPSVIQISANMNIGLVLDLL